MGGLETIVAKTEEGQKLRVRTKRHIRDCGEGVKRGARRIDKFLELDPGGKLGGSIPALGGLIGSRLGYKGGEYKGSITLRKKFKKARNRKNAAMKKGAC